MIAGLVQREQTIGWNDYGMWEYLLVAQPDKNVYAKVAAEKAWFAQTYKHALAAVTKPHITIANFLAKEGMEETLIRWMQTILKPHKSFGVTLAGFSGFAPHTIYLKIENAAPFIELAKGLQAIDGYIQASDCPPLYTVNQPHLTIARRLPAMAYRQALQHYSAKRFEDSFIVSELHLLKRKHPYERCKTATIFRLAPDQLALFN